MIRRSGLVLVLALSFAPVDVAALGPPDAPNTVRSLLGQARKALRKSRWDEARKLALRAREADQPGGEADELLERIGQEQVAASQLQVALGHEKAGRIEKAWLVASDGLAQGRTRAWKGLRKLERRVRKVLANAAIEQGKRLLRAKKLREAEAAFTKALQYDPNNRRAQNGLRRVGASQR